MDFNLILLLTVVFSCVTFVLRTAFSQGNRGWAIVASTILTIIGTLLYFAPQWASWVGGGLWTLFLVLPLLGFAQVNRLIVQQRYRAARQLVSYLRWLHPTDGWFEQPTILQALEQGQQGQMAMALQSLRPHEGIDHPMGRHATALLLLMDARWHDLLRWFSTHVPETVLRRDPHLLMYYLRALGETGDLNGLVRGLERYERDLKKGSSQTPLHLVQLFALAFCGDVEGVQQLIKHALTNYPSAIQQFWRLTAQRVAMPQRQADEALRNLQKQQGDRILTQAIDWRLAHPPNDPRVVLSPKTYESLQRLQSTVKQDIRYGRPLVFKPTKAYVTYALLLANGIFFALEIYYGGSQSQAALAHLGALIPEAVRQGQWWRLLNANFLHYGWTHLLTNSLGLYLLGPFVEANLGRWRYLLTYLSTGIGTMGIFTLWTLWENSPTPKQLVGASAAIMGLLGVIIVILWHRWRQARSRIAAERLRTFGLIIGFQFLFDFLIPEISGLAHTVGLILGLGWGIIWSGLIQKRIKG
ncbi:MAG: rhomboid family intramembrane serine protease [Spirulina sp. SIO3F2]|nr:rhomboid family intramembrane serine protease [Spirulina sp. SIO3F2]